MPRDPGSTAPSACVFAPAPLLTITIELAAHGGEDPEVHLHPGGQGFWIARMLRSLDIDVVLCASVGGETGTVLRALLDQGGMHVQAVQADGSNGAYVHDRRSGERQEIAAMPGSHLSRHDLDELYGVTVAAALDADVTVLGGPSDEGVIPPDTYRRLATDLRSNGCTVVADLSGDPLAAVLEGGIDVLKVSHEELIAEGRAESADRDQVIPAMHRLVEDGAAAVVVTRAEDPTLALIGGQVVELIGPRLEPVDTRGGGDSVTAGIAAGLAQGMDLREALELGTAAGALNVTRRGLASGSHGPIAQVSEHVHTTTQPEQEDD